MLEPTDKQANVRDHPSNSLLITAPAGCGKTEALALRVLGLISRGGIEDPRKVLVTTFSNRARDNVRDRLRSHISRAVMRDRITVCNFHGLSARIFRAHANVLQLSPDMTLPENDWVGDQCRSRKLGYKDAAFVQDVLRRIKQSALDDEGVQNALSRAGSTHASEVEALRVSENRLTYDDLPRLAELILQNHAVAQLYRSHFSAVIVDEFQDLTPQQLRIINSIGFGKTTYAGDLAQGIYGFAGASPAAIFESIKAECKDNAIQFAESHRSSPGVLSLVNALNPVTGGIALTSARPDSWPGGGLAGVVGFENTDQETHWVTSFARYTLERSATQRIAVISRLKSRRRFIDLAFEEEELPVHRWDNAILDTETAKIVRSVLTRLDLARFACAADPVAMLRDEAKLDSVQDPSVRESLADALAWCCDLLLGGENPQTIRSKVVVGDEETLLDVPGVHLLTGHVGKGQQFDWVVVIGAEDGCIPDFRAEESEEIMEEARILSVMISRARHGAVVTHSRSVAAQGGVVYRKQPSRFLTNLQTASPLDSYETVAWMKQTKWDKIHERG